MIQSSTKVSFSGNRSRASLNRSGRSVAAGVRYNRTPLTLLAIVGNYWRRYVSRLAHPRFESVFGGARRRVQPRCCDTRAARHRRRKVPAAGCDAARVPEARIRGSSELVVFRTNDVRPERHPRHALFLSGLRALLFAHRRSAECRPASVRAPRSAGRRRLGTHAVSMARGIAAKREHCQSTSCESGFRVASA